MKKIDLESTVKIKIEHAPLFQSLLKNVKADDKFSETRVLVELGKNDLTAALPFFEKALLSDFPALQLSALHEIFESTKRQPHKAYEAISTLFQNPAFNTPFAETRVLVELGKKNPELVFNALAEAVENNNESLQWSTLGEITELCKTHPALFTPLLEKLMEHENPNLQWAATLAALQLNDPQQTDSVEMPLEPAKRLFNIDHDNIELSLALVESALDSENSELEWQAILELVDLATAYPDKVIPLIEKSLEVQNPHVQWLASLELLELSKQYPNEVLPLLENAIQTSEILKTPAISETRILVELAKNGADHVLPLLQLGLQSPDANLRWAAMLELIELGKNKNTGAQAILKEFVQEQTLFSSHQEIRVLTELGKQDPQQVFMLLKTAIVEGKSALQLAAFRELIELAKHNQLELENL